MIKTGEERIREISPDLDVAKVRVLGNMLRHHYEMIDPQTIWLTIKESLPPLRRDCEAELERGGGAEESL